MATILVRPVSRVTFSAASLASLPEFAQERARGEAAAGQGVQALGQLDLRHRGEQVRHVHQRGRLLGDRPHQARVAVARAPTAMPPSRSRYFLPSTSHTWTPSPRSRTRGGVPKVFIRAEEYRPSIVVVVVMRAPPWFRLLHR